MMHKFNYIYLFYDINSRDKTKFFTGYFSVKVYIHFALIKIFAKLHLLYIYVLTKQLRSNLILCRNE